MAVALYARKSTESEDRQVQSLDDQLRVLKDLAEREGIVVDEIFVESKSAKAPGERPEFNRLIESIQNGEVTGILTWAIDRLARNMVDGGQIVHLLQTGKLEFIRTYDRTHRPEDNVLLLSIESGMATNYIQDLSRNVKRGMHGKVERGGFPWKAPLGYINNPVTRGIDPDPQRYHLVKRGWSMLLSGNYTMTEIRRELSELGLTSHLPSRVGEAVSVPQFYKLFRNPFYAGIVQFSGGTSTGSHLPMITPAQFDQGSQMGRRNLVRKYQVHDHFFAGMFKCRNCGGHNVGEKKVKWSKEKGRAVEYVYYRCSAMKGCRKVSMSESAIYKEADRIVNGIRIKPAFMTWAGEELVRQADAEKGSVEPTKRALEDSLQNYEHMLQQARLKVVSGELTGEDLRAIKSQLEVQSTEARKQLNNVLTEAERINEYVEDKLEIAVRANSYKVLERSARRGLIRSLGRQHYLTLGKLEVDLNPVLQKIASFELLRNGSRIPKVGDFVPANSLWWSLIADLRSVARNELLREDEDSS